MNAAKLAYSHHCHWDMTVLVGLLIAPGRLRETGSFGSDAPRAAA
jgi:hypothetical protein